MIAAVSMSNKITINERFLHGSMMSTLFDTSLMIDDPLHVHSARPGYTRTLSD
jgi:hypothetical protein